MLQTLQQCRFIDELLVLHVAVLQLNIYSLSESERDLSSNQRKLT